MKDSNVQHVLSELGKKIPSDKVFVLKNKLLEAEDNKVEEILSQKYYNPTATLIFAIFLGGLGVDRFIVGDVGKGICKILFGWLTLGIWPFIDIFCSHKTAKNKNFEKIMLLL